MGLALVHFQKYWLLSGNFQFQTNYAPVVKILVAVMGNVIPTLVFVPVKLEGMARIVLVSL